MEKKDGKFTFKKFKLTEKHKKIGLVCLLFVGVIAAGCANYFLTNDITPKESKQTSAGEDAFEVFRQEKSDSRAEQMTYIESVVDSAEANKETKEKAEQQKLELAANMEAETAVEGMIRTTLDADAVVTVSSSSVSVVIDKAKLTDAEAAQIAEIVTAQTGQSANNIKIMPQKQNAASDSKDEEKESKSTSSEDSAKESKDDGDKKVE